MTTVLIILGVVASYALFVRGWMNFQDSIKSNETWAAKWEE